MTARLALLLLSVSVPPLAGAVAHSGGTPVEPSGRAPAEAIHMEAGPAFPALPEVVTDTILRRNLDEPVGSVVGGLAASSAEPHVRLGLRRIPVGVAGVGRRDGPRALAGIRLGAVADRVGAPPPTSADPGGWIPARSHRPGSGPPRVTTTGSSPTSPTWP